MSSSYKKELRSKLKAFCQKNPVLVEWSFTESGVHIKLPNVDKSYTTSFDEIIENTPHGESVAHTYVQRLNTVLQQYYPTLVYRKYHSRPKTVDEMTLSLMKGDESTAVVEEDTDARAAFTVIRVDLRKSIFTLEKEHTHERILFHFEPAALFLLRLRKGEESAEELGKVFFARARKIKQLRGGSVSES